MPYATITALNIYPVKSCRGIALERATLTVTGLEHDRHWMVVNEGGRFLTQRELPRLALVIPQLTPRGLSLTAPGMPPLHLSLDSGGSPLEVTVIADRCTAIDAGEEASAWFTEFLQKPIRVVRFDPQARRPIHPKLWQGDIDTHIEFSDGFPLLLISQASLDDLNTRLGAPLPMNRFRPSIVLEGLQAYDEDRIRELSDGALRLQMARPCTRCKITTTDQVTAEVAGAEPLLTLRSYRWNAQLRGVMFGQYAIVAGGVDAQLRVGQHLEVTWA